MKTTYAGHPCAVHKRFDLAGANSSGLRLNTRQATRAFIYTLIVLVSSSVTAAPDLGVVNYQLVSQKRLSLTVYDYTYRATVRNNGSEATGVNATLITYPAAVTPQDATLSFGDVAANTSQVSADTFVLRHNRTQGAFDTTKLFWTFDFQNPNLGLLDGPLGRPAVEATTDYSERTATYTPAQISETGFGPGVLFRRILRTRVLLKVKADA